MLGEFVIGGSNGEEDDEGIFVVLEVVVLGFGECDELIFDDVVLRLHPLINNKDESNISFIIFIFYIPFYLYLYYHILLLNYISLFIFYLLHYTYIIN